MKVTVVLTGPDTGRTCLLHGKDFVNGEMVVSGNPGEVETQLRYIARTCRAYPVGSPDLAEAQERDHSRGIQHSPSSSPGQRDHERLRSSSRESPRGVQEVSADHGPGLDPVVPADGSEGLGAGGSGHADSWLPPEQITQIGNAVLALDPENDSHWTEDGLPSVEALAAALVNPSISRQTIEAIAPGYTREKVLEAVLESQI